MILLIKEYIENNIHSFFNLFMFTAVMILIFKKDPTPYKSLIRKWQLFCVDKVKIIKYSQYSDRFEVDLEENVLYASTFSKLTHSKRDYIYSIAHEFGHIIDQTIDDIELTPEEIYEKQIEPQQVYNTEVAAWNIAEELIRTSEAYSKKEFDALRDKCLRDYRQHLSLGEFASPKSKKTIKIKQIAKEVISKRPIKKDRISGRSLDD